MTQLDLQVVEGGKSSEELRSRGSLRDGEPALPCKPYPNQEAIRRSESQAPLFGAHPVRHPKARKEEHKDTSPAPCHSQQLHRRKRSKRKATNHDQQTPRQLPGSLLEGRGCTASTVTQPCRNPSFWQEHQREDSQGCLCLESSLFSC